MAFQPPDPSPAHEKRESKAMERQEHKTGREMQDERKKLRGGKAQFRKGARRGSR